MIYIYFVYTSILTVFYVFVNYFGPMDSLSLLMQIVEKVGGVEKGGLDRICWINLTRGLDQISEQFIWLDTRYPTHSFSGYQISDKDRICWVNFPWTWQDIRNIILTGYQISDIDRMYWVNYPWTWPDIQTIYLTGYQISDTFCFLDTRYQI